MTGTTANHPDLAAPLPSRLPPVERRPVMPAGGGTGVAVGRDLGEACVVEGSEGAT